MTSNKHFSEWGEMMSDTVTELQLLTDYYIISLVQELFDKGKIQENDMRFHPRKNTVTACISAKSKVKLHRYLF